MRVLVCQDCGKTKASKKGAYCKICGYKHRNRPSGLTYILCKENPSKFKKGQVPWNKSLLLGESSPAWKGDSAGYDALHDWAGRHINKPKICENCASTTNVELSNISGKYKRDLIDWWYLCKKCHHKYDYEKFGARKEFFR